MEDYFKISFASFMAFAISSLLSYLVQPYNDVLASVIAWGAIIMLVIATFAFAVAIYCFVFQTFAHQQRKEYSDDCREQNRIEMFEIVSTDVETSKLCYVDKACDALEKIASASGDGTFDKQDIMRAAVDFRERADVIRRHTAILIEARRNGHVDGVKELIDSYIAEPLFAGFDDAVMNYLPESFHNPNYLNVDEAVYGNYKVLKGLC
jgi:hypothetical protein